MHPAAKKIFNPFIQSFLLFIFIFLLQFLLNVKLTTNICTLKQPPPQKKTISHSSLPRAFGIRPQPSRRSALKDLREKNMRGKEEGRK